MADKNALLERNAGQRHYEETVNNTGSSTRATWGPRGRRRVPRTSNYHDQAVDYHDRMSYTDNSQPTSSLRDYEPTESQWSDFYNDIGYDNNDAQDSEATTSQSGDAFLDNSADKAAESSRDLATQEREASYESSGFNNNVSKTTFGLNTSRSSNGLKKKLVGGGIGLFVLCGLALAGFTAISGPMQLIQAASVLTDYVLNITNWQQTTRSLKNSGTIIDKMSEFNEYSKNNSSIKLSKMANNQAEKLESTLAEQGLTFNKNGSMTIDVGSETLAKQKFESLGISKASLNGSKIEIPNTVSYSDAKKAINSFDDVGNSKIASWLQSRATLKKNGYVSWLHPFEKIKSDTMKNLDNFISDQIGKMKNNSDNVSKHASDQNDDDNEKAKEEDANNSDPDAEKKGLDEADLDDANSQAKEVISNAVDDGADILDKGSSSLRGAFTKLRNAATDIQGMLTAFPVQITRLMVSMVCLVQSISENNGPYKMANIVNVAIKASSLLLGYSSQVKSGEDITMDLAGNAVKMMLGAEINGKYVTAWSSRWFCNILGSSGCTTEITPTESSLRSVGDGATYTGSDAIDGFINGVGSLLIDNIFIHGICFLNDAVDVIDSLTSWLSGDLFGMLTDALSFGADKTNAFASLIESFTNYVMGEPLDLTNASPYAYGSILGYGIKFMANDQALGIGGKLLSSSAAIELNLENRRFLAWQNSQKPLIARLIDPSDYNSSLNQVARAAQINTSDQSFTTQVANVFKSLVSAPSIIASAANQLAGGSAYAASAYDYGNGIGTYGYELSEMDTVLNDDSYDVYNNMVYVLDNLLEPEDEYLKNNNNEPSMASTPYHYYASKCLSVDITSVSKGASVSLNKNNDGEDWNYVEANNNQNQCNKDGDNDYLRLRLYVMDYFTTLSNACYNSDEDDSTGNSACSEMGINGSSSSSSSSISQDAEELQKAFAATGGVQTISSGYTFNVCSNGCTTIPAWYIMNYTTGLNYQGRGNGRDVVRYLVEDNPDLEESSTPRAPAIFSTSSWHSQTMCGGSLCGHTGLVTDVADDGTLTVLETGSGRCNEELKSAITQVPKSEWEGNMTFVYLGDHLK